MCIKSFKEKEWEKFYQSIPREKEEWFKFRKVNSIGYNNQNLYVSNNIAPKI